MKKYFISLLSKPRRIITLSLVIAVFIGVWGYFNFNKIPVNKFNQGDNTPATENITLNFSISGSIKNILVKQDQKVKKGETLVVLDPDNKDGSFIQAEALYEGAQANYQKILNGATSATIDVARAAVNTAQINFDQVTKQQDILVANAYRTLLNSTITAETIGDFITGYVPPIVSGTYTCDKEGSYDLKSYGSTGGVSVSYSGLEQGSLLLNDILRPIGHCGLFLSFDKNKILEPGIEFQINIPNKKAPNYNVNYNSYQLSLQAKDQAIASAQAGLDQAKAALASIVISARPEDMATARAQVENTYGALVSNPTYMNTIIAAPEDGIVKNIFIKSGQSVLQNDPIILFVKSNNKI